MAAAPSGAQTVFIEAENYTDYHDITYEIIRSVPGSSCSGGYVLIGLDYPDEWTAYDAAVDSAGVYSVTLLCRGDIGVQYRLHLLLEEAGEDPQVVDFNFTGAGFG